MKNQSLTVGGLAILALIFLGESVGIEIGSEEINTTLTTLGKACGIAVAWYGRFRQGDINIFGRKK